MQNIEVVYKNGEIVNYRTIPRTICGYPGAMSFQDFDNGRLYYIPSKIVESVSIGEKKMVRN